MVYYHENRLLSLNPESPVDLAGAAIPQLSCLGLLWAYGKSLDRSNDLPQDSSAQVRASERLGKNPEAATIVLYWVRRQNPSNHFKIRIPEECSNSLLVEKARSILTFFQDLGLIKLKKLSGQVPSFRVIDQSFLGEHHFGVCLETYVAATARKLLGKDRVLAHANLTWNRDEETSLPTFGAPKNEVDVLAADRNQLHYFSCKCDGQAKSLTLSKELDVIDASARALGGIHTRKVLVTNADLSTKREVQVKARVLRIVLIDRQHLPDLERFLLPAGEKSLDS